MLEVRQHSEPSYFPSHLSSLPCPLEYMNGGLLIFELQLGSQALATRCVKTLPVVAISINKVKMMVTEATKRNMRMNILFFFFGVGVDVK